METPASEQAKRKFRPLGIRKRYSLGTLLAMGAALVVYLQGFAPVCPYLPEGFWRALCESATRAPENREHRHRGHRDGDVESDAGVP